MGEMLAGGFIMPELVGEYCEWVDLRYAWCWYGACWCCCGMAVAVENVVAMVASSGGRGWEMVLGRRLEVQDQVGEGPPGWR